MRGDFAEFDPKWKKFSDQFSLQATEPVNLSKIEGVPIHLFVGSKD